MAALAAVGAYVSACPTQPAAQGYLTQGGGGGGGGIRRKMDCQNGRMDEFFFRFFAPSADRRRGLNSAYMSEGDSTIFRNNAKKI